MYQSHSLVATFVSVCMATTDTDTHVLPASTWGPMQSLRGWLVKRITTHSCGSHYTQKIITRTLRCSSTWYHQKPKGVSDHMEITERHHV